MLVSRCLRASPASKGVFRRSFFTNGASSRSSGKVLTGGVVTLLIGGASGFALSDYLRSHKADIPIPQPTHPTKPQYGSEADLTNALNALRKAFPDDNIVSTDEGERLSYALGVAYPPPGTHTSQVVVHARSTEDVVTVVNISRKFRIPVVPYTGGTGLEKGIEGLKSGTICIDLSGMDRILEINEANADVVVQAGVSWNVLNDTLKEKGIPLFFPLDPGLGATIGGMISTGCSGTNAMRYGTARGEWILNMTVVLPSGKVIKTRQRARKSSAGFDLGKLFVGAEGTLGIITEATIRLAPILPTTVAVVQFPSVRHATEAACEILNLGAPIQCVELLDSDFLRVLSTSPLRSTSQRGVQDTLYVKIQGAPSLPSAPPADMDAQMLATSTLMEHVMKKHGATGYQLAKDRDEAEALWAERRSALFVLTGYAHERGLVGYGMDVCVPVSKLPDLVDVAKREFEKAGLFGPILGHVGDGNFHAFLTYKDEEDLKRVHAAADKIVETAIALEGTCTGEHGVGTGKKKYLDSELGTETVKTMKRIKATLDPLGLFNPGKLYPDSLDE